MTKAWLSLLICVVVIAVGFALGQSLGEAGQEAESPTQAPPDPSPEEWTHVGEFEGSDFYIRVYGMWAFSQGDSWFTDEYDVTVLHILPGWPPSHISVDFLVRTCFLTGERSVIEKEEDRFEVLEPYGQTWVTTKFKFLSVPREIDSFLLQFNTWTVDAEDSAEVEEVHRVKMIRDSLQFKAQPEN